MWVSKCIWSIVVPFIFEIHVWTVFHKTNGEYYMNLKLLSFSFFNMILRMFSYILVYNAFGNKYVLKTGKITKLETNTQGFLYGLFILIWHGLDVGSLNDPLCLALYCYMIAKFPRYSYIMFLPPPPPPQKKSSLELTNHRHSVICILKLITLVRIQKYLKLRIGFH